MATTSTRENQTTLSALQRRLMVARSRPDRRWIILVENVPCWPAGRRPRELAEAGEFPYSYADSQGEPALRDTVALRESLVSKSLLICPSNVVITAGGLNALGLVFRDCHLQGYRHAIYPVPTFRGVHDLLTATGFATCALALTGEDAELDIWLLRNADGASSVLYLNFPHNPTGRAPRAEYIDAILSFARDTNIFVVYDAVYDSFRFTADAGLTPVDRALSDSSMVIVNSLSKNYGRPGDRIGWALAAEPVVARLVSRLEWETVSINSQAQHSAANVLVQGNAALVEAVRRGREIYREHARGPFAIDLPSAGTQVWVDLGIDDVEEFADFALDRYALVLTTSSNYAPVLPSYLRFPTGIPEDLMTEGLRRTQRALADWQGKAR